jgi:hypothetical protein
MYSAAATERCTNAVRGAQLGGNKGGRVRALAWSGRPRRDWAAFAIEAQLVNANPLVFSHVAREARPRSARHRNSIDWLHRERLRRRVILPALPHRGVGGLDVTGKPCRIEQRISAAIARQFGLD